MSAAATVLQLVRAHYRRDESAFGSAALQLARSAKTPLISNEIGTLVRQGFRSDGARQSPGTHGLRPLKPSAEPIGALQPLRPVTFADLQLEPDVQALLDEIVVELEYREELRARNLRARNRLLFHGPPGNGKCLQVGTLVMRFDGALVPVESVSTGDLLMGPDSLPRRVLGTTTGTGPLYRVVPVKGDPWVCNDVHVLTVVDTDTGRITDIDVQRYLAASNWFRERSKLFTPENGVDFEPGPELPIDPYFLGVWYGDGTKALDRKGELACVAVSKPDQEIADLMALTAERYGAKLRVQTSGSGCPTYCISMGNTGGTHRNVLLDELRAVFADGDQLPQAYLTAPRADREQFLAGLLDTDGTDNCGGFEVVQRVRGFADGICFLARSLGLRATMGPKLVAGETYWRILISGECSGLPLRIARKRAAPRQQIKRVNRTGFTIEPVGVGEYAGFELDGDGRFLLGDFTVTHNTSAASAVANALDCTPYCVSIPELVSCYLGETAKNLAKIFESMREGVVVVFDEIDAIGTSRNDGSSGSDKERNSTVNALLTLLDRQRGGMIVATTNRPEIIDPALLRRFDDRILFPEPNVAQKRALGERLAEKFGIEPVAVDDCANFDELTKRVETEARRIVMRELLAADSAPDEPNDDE